MPLEYLFWTPAPVCQSGRLKSVLRPPPLPQPLLHMLLSDPSDQTDSLTVLVLWSTTARVPPTATDQGSVDGKSTVRSPKFSSSKAAQSPLATKMVICSACVKICRLWSIALTSPGVSPTSGAPKLMLTILPLLELLELSLMIACSSSLRRVGSLLS